MKYQEAEGGEPVEDLASALKNEVYDYRTLELFVNLIALAPFDKRPRFLDYLRQIGSEIKEADGINLNAELIEYVDQKYDSSAHRVKIVDIADMYNEGRQLAEQVTNRQIGEWLNNIGFTRLCRFGDGKNGRRISPEHLQRVKARYGRKQTTLEECG